MKKTLLILPFVFILSACSLSHYTWVEKNVETLEKPVSFHVSTVKSDPVKKFFQDGYVENKLKDEIEQRLKKNKLLGNDYAIEVEIESFWPGERTWIISGDCSASIKFIARIRKGINIYSAFTTSYMRENDGVIFTVNNEGISKSCGKKTINQVLQTSAQSLVDAIREELTRADSIKSSTPGEMR